jgi:hypothetical protein
VTWSLAMPAAWALAITCVEGQTILARFPSRIPSQVLPRAPGLELPGDQSGRAIRRLGDADEQQHAASVNRGAHLTEEFRQIDPNWRNSHGSCCKYLV